jgi:hypothetical protein
MIIWQGIGILVGIVIFAMVIAVKYSVGAIMNDPDYYQLHGWPKLIALWLAAAALYVMARQLDKVPGRVLVDKATGQEVVLKSRHSLFFIPVKGWSFISFALGIILLFR